MKNINRILLIILGIGLIAWATYLIITAIPYRDKESEESIVKCFDKYGNEIIGQECISINDYSGDFGARIIFAFWLAIGGIFIIVTQIRILIEEQK